MDSFHHHHHHHHQQHDRRMLGQTLAGGGGDHQWYPSSSPPPPPPPGGYFNHPQPHQQQIYHYPPLPPQPHLQQHQHHHPMGMRPPPPPHPQAQPPYHGQPPPYPHHSQCPPPPLPPRSHHPISMPHHLPPPMPLAYPLPPNQAWGNTSWVQHQGWDYPERNVLYNNEEDWAARAKAWASAKSGTENHHAQSHFASVGRTDERSYPYNDQYQQAVGPPRDVQHPSFPQSSNQQLPVSMMDPLKQVNHLHGSTPFSSGSSSYGTGSNAGDESTSTNAEHRASPQKSYGTSSSVYEQEVSYSYSSDPGNREAVRRRKGSHVPLPLPVSSVKEGYPSQSTLSVQMISAEQVHFSNHGAPTNFLPDACDRPLEFERRHDSDRESHQKINYEHAGLAGAVGMVDHDPAASSLPAWSSSTAPGVVFPQIPLGPTGTQFDPSFIPQTSLPMQPSPAFGGIPAPSFQSIVPPVSSPYGLSPGASLHAAAFSGDLSGALNPSERPKKAAVPNWLREEIIKKKSVIPNAVSTQPPGNSFGSIGSEDGNKSLRRADQGDSKSTDSTRSIEDEDDDEEDVEATRSAAINQEIKRVLTEVLLKVTDELFDEIATKVLNEDEHTVGAAEESAINGNRKVSPPTAIPTPKASAKVLVPVKMETNKVTTVGENSRTISHGGNVLGLANYASDDDEEEIQSSKLLSSGKKRSAHEQENNEKPSENGFKSVKDEADDDGVAQKHGAALREESYMMKNSSLSVDNLHYPDKASEGVSTACESIPLDQRKVEELPSESAISSQSKDVAGAKDDKGKESTNAHAKSDKSLTKDYRDRESRKDMGREDYKASTEKASHETSDAIDSVIHEDGNKLKEKKDRRDKLKERVDDRSSERGSNVKESDSRRSSKHNSAKDDRKETVKNKQENYKEDGERKRERARDEKEDRSTRGTKDSSRYSRRSPSPSGRGKNVKTNSFSHGSASGDEPSDNSKTRKRLSHNSSLSPSPTKSRKRQVSWSSPSKHSHRRHSPYSSTERRRRSRSTSPGHQRSSAHKRGS